MQRVRSFIDTKLFIDRSAVLPFLVSPFLRRARRLYIAFDFRPPYLDAPFMIPLEIGRILSFTSGHLSSISAYPSRPEAGASLNLRKEELLKEGSLIPFSLFLTSAAVVKYEMGLTRGVQFEETWFAHSGFSGGVSMIACLYYVQRNRLWREASVSVTRWRFMQVPKGSERNLWLLSTVT